MLQVVVPLFVGVALRKSRISVLVYDRSYVNTIGAGNVR